MSGVAGRRFVEREHDPRMLARKALEGLAELPPTDSHRLTAPGNDDITVVIPCFRLGRYLHEAVDSA